MQKVVVEVLVGVIVNEQNKGLESEQFSALQLLDDIEEKQKEETEQQ